MKKQQKIVHDSILPGNYYQYKDAGKAFGLSENKLDEYAKNTVDILTGRMISLEITTWNLFAKYYNTFSNGLSSDKNVNLFLWSTQLQPIAHLFKLFVKEIPTKNGGKNIYCDFGILKSHLDKYVSTGKVPTVANRGRPKTNHVDPTKNNRTKIDIPHCPIYHTFRDGIHAINRMYPNDKITVPEALLSAMAEYMESREEIFGNPQVVESRVKKNTAKSINVEIPSNVKAALTAAVERYNAINKPTISLKQFVRDAIIEKLKRMPAEYVDPSLARRLKKLEDSI